MLFVVREVAMCELEGGCNVCEVGENAQNGMEDCSEQYAMRD
jgi:hypothetical protein